MSHYEVAIIMYIIHLIGGSRAPPPLIYYFQYKFSILYVYASKSQHYYIPSSIRRT